MKFGWRKWKAAISWVLIAAMLGGYGNTALAVEIGNSDGGNLQEIETGSVSEGDLSAPAEPEMEEAEEDTAEAEAGAEEDTAEAEVEPAALQEDSYQPYWENPNFSNLIVFVDFADTTHEHSTTFYAGCYKEDTEATFRYFNGGETEPMGMREYLNRISYGQLRVENMFPQYDSEADEITPYALSKNGAYYAEHESEMITEIIERLNSSGQLRDNMILDLKDGNQVLDNLTIVVPCDNGNLTSLFVGHKASYAGGNRVAGSLVRDYTVVTEGGIYFSQRESGQIVHEFLHTLGYPDLYRGVVEANQKKGMPVALWDIMATQDRRLQYPLAYLRSDITNWFEIPTLTESQTGLSLYAATATTEETKDRQALILKTDYSDTEFFVVEYRKKGLIYQNEYEAGIPGSGLIIYRVNTKYYTNYTGPPDYIYVFRPNDAYRNDGSEEGGGDIYDSYLSLESGRTFYGRSSFSDSLEEGAITYSDGMNSGIVIRNVGSSAGDQITFDVEFYERDESEYWRLEAQEEERAGTSEAASCMTSDGRLYALLKKGNTAGLYECINGGFTRLGGAPAGSEYRLEEYGGKLYTAYLDSQRIVRLARWNGSSWKELYHSPQAANTINELSMTSDTKGVYLAYQYMESMQKTQIFAVRYTSDGISSLGGAVCTSSKYVSNPSIAAENGTIVLMYREAFNGNRVYVKRYDNFGNSWSDVGSQTLTADTGMIRVRDGRVYLLKNGNGSGQNGAYLYVYDLKRGKAWEQIGENAYTDASVTEMDLCFAGGEPYIAYTAGSQSRVTEVKRLKDDQWVSLGSSLVREDIFGLRLYSYERRLYAVYLNCVNQRTVVRSHDSESTGTDDMLWELFPDALDCGTVVLDNPFRNLVERTENGSAGSAAAFAAGRYTDSFGSQIEDPLARELYDLMTARYAKGRQIGEQRAELENLLSFPAKISSGELVQDANYQAAGERLINCFRQAYGAFYMDYPSVFWMNGMRLSWGVGYNSSTGKAFISSVLLQLSGEYYNGASARVDEYDRAVQAAKEEIEAAVEDPQDRYQTVQAIHAYLCKRLSYDGEAGNDLNGEEYGYAHTSSTVFLGYYGEYQVVCEGYAKAFKVLCEQWGIPCTLVIGQWGTPGSMNPHMWNYVQMEDGLWYGMDVTWDDQDSGMRLEYFLAGSNTPGVNGYTFGQEHKPDMEIMTGILYPFAYPELEEEKYDARYKGSILTDAEGRWLRISEADAGEALSKEEIVTILRKNERFAPFNGISVIRTDENGALAWSMEEEIVNASVSVLKKGGTLEFVFRQSDTGKYIQWELTGLHSASRNFDGFITAQRLERGVWNLTLGDSGFPADSVRAAYSELGLAASYGGTETIYYYQIAEDGERTFCQEGSYEDTTAEESGFGELHILHLNRASDLEAGVSYTAETARYDWRLEYGYTADADGAEAGGRIEYYTMEEALIEGVRTLCQEGSNIRIGCVGEGQPTVIPANLLDLCAQKSLNLEYTRREDAGLSYTWSLQGITSTGGEDFDLGVALAMRDAALPIEFLERTYIRVAPAGRTPACKSVELKIRQDGIALRFADAELLSLWQQEGGTLTWLREAELDAKEGNWVSFTLNQPSAATGDEVYLLSGQSLYGWQMVQDENEEWHAIYIENRTGRHVTGWQIVEGRKCYFDGNGYLCEGPTKVSGVWYLFGSYPERTQGLCTGYQNGYYANASGVLQKGWQKIGNIWHYFSTDESGYGKEQPSSQTGCWVTMPEGSGAMAEGRYYFRNNATLSKNWQTIEGRKYYFDSQGRMYTDTRKIGSAYYHFRTDQGMEGVLGTGLFVDGGKTYYANGSGVLLRGWQKIEGIWRFFNHDTGAEEEGFIKTNYWAVVSDEEGKTAKISYFINGTKIATGWQTIEGRRYYFDGNGILQTGFFRVGSNTYYGREASDLAEHPGEAAAGEQVIGDETYYFGSNYVMYVGWQKIGGIWRYFSTDAASPARGRELTVSAPEVEGSSWYWYTIEAEDGARYCFRNNTTLLKGWQTINGQRYYLNSSTGAVAEDTTLTIGKYVYCFDPKGVMQKNTVVDGYCYNANGYRVTGWQKLNNVWRYFNQTNTKDPDSWKEIPSGRSGYWVTLEFGGSRGEELYYFRNNTSMVKNWQTIDGKRYYFDPKTGVLRTGNEDGLFLIGSNAYYLGADGALRYGWIREPDGRSYYANTSSGVLLVGWQKIDNLWYYFDKTTRQQDENARVENNYFATATDGGIMHTYYFVKGTSPAKGWQTISGSRYYFDANGVMQTQRTKIGNAYYFFGPDGKMRTGFVKYCETMYYFHTNGQMRKDWQTIGGQRYYFDAEGVLQTGFSKIGTATYYFDERQETLGRLLKGVQKIGDSTYYFNTNGVLLYGWQKVNNVWRFFDVTTGAELETEAESAYWMTIRMPDGRTERSYINNGKTILKGWQKIGGQRYYFDGNGVQWTESKGWLTIGNNRFYFDSAKNNSVHQGFLELTDTAGKQHTYYLNANGQALKSWQTIKVGGVSGKYYLNTSDGEVYMGHQKVGSAWYYFDPANRGRMATGYITIPQDGSYYYNTNGVLFIGWQKLKGEADYRYFDGAGDGNGQHIGVERILKEKQVQSVTVGKKTTTYHWYEIDDADSTINVCFLNNATLLKNRQTIDGKYYWFHSSTGALYTGYFAIGQNRYYSNEDGSVYTGFDPEDPTSEGNICYYNAYGQRVSGWQTIKDASGASAKYYFNANGIMLKGICWIGNTRYVFHPQNGKMITDSVVIDGKTYYANTNGTLKSGL